MPRTTLLLLCCLSLPLLAKEPPNIVLILADDVGCEPLGCYGGSSWPTPHIDTLATGGLRFRHCYSMPVCHPTRVCLLTGRYPKQVGNPAWGSFPKFLEPHTLGHLLGHAGYATAVAGKWQLALLGDDLQHPHRLGFDEYCLFGWHEGPRYHDPLIWQNGARRTDTQGKYGPDLYVDFLVDFMRRHRERRFFAFYSMALCHDVTDDLAEPVPYVPGKSRYLHYGEMVRSMDQCVGRIVSAIDDLNLRGRTLIVFTGDNGTAVRSIVRAQRQPGSGKWQYLRASVQPTRHGKVVSGGKGSLTDAGTRVPLIVNWQGQIAAPRVTDTLVDFSDFLPTFSELSGRKVPRSWDVDGHSFAWEMLGSEANPRRWAFSEGRGRFWVRDHDWKLYSDATLYHIASDPRETQPQPAATASPAAKEARQRLQAAIDAL